MLISFATLWKFILCERKISIFLWIFSSLYFESYLQLVFLQLCLLLHLKFYIAFYRINYALASFHSDSWKYVCLEIKLKFHCKWNVSGLETLKYACFPQSDFYGSMNSSNTKCWKNWTVCTIRSTRRFSEFRFITASLLYSSNVLHLTRCCANLSYCVDNWLHADIVKTKQNVRFREMASCVIQRTIRTFIGPNCWIKRYRYDSYFSIYVYDIH